MHAEKKKEVGLTEQTDEVIPGSTQSFVPLAGDCVRLECSVYGLSQSPNIIG